MAAQGLSHGVFGKDELGDLAAVDAQHGHAVIVIEDEVGIAVNVEDVVVKRLLLAQALEEILRLIAQVAAMARDQLDAQSRSHRATISRVVAALVGSVQDALDEAGIETCSQEVFVVAEAAVEVDVGLDAFDDALEEGAT